MLLQSATPIVHHLCSSVSMVNAMLPVPQVPIKIIQTCTARSVTQTAKPARLVRLDAHLARPPTSTTLLVWPSALLVTIAVVACACPALQMCPAVLNRWPSRPRPPLKITKLFSTSNLTKKSRLMETPPNLFPWTSKSIGYFKIIPPWSTEDYLTLQLLCLMAPSKLSLTPVSVLPTLPSPSPSTTPPESPPTVEPLLKTFNPRSPISFSTLILLEAHRMLLWSSLAPSFQSRCC